MQTNLDLYTDYLLSSFGQTSATGLSALLEGTISHDDVTRFLTQLEGSSQALWQQVKPLVRQIEQPTGQLILDDCIIEKAYTDPNGLVTTHYDHAQERYVNGINFVTALYQVGNQRLPVGYELVVKTWRCQLKDHREVWKSERTKNEMFRDLVSQAARNLTFEHVLCDSWYTNAENIRHVLGLSKHLIGAVKSNLEVALSPTDKRAGHFVRVSQLKLDIGLVRVYIRGLDQALFLGKDRHINADGSQGTVYLLTSDTTLSFQQLLSHYQTRWGIEEYHKSLKNNASIAKSPTKTIQTQTNHFFASLCAYAKLEGLKIHHRLNQFALKQRLYLKAIRAAMTELAALKATLA